jgi:hypothetical protein
VLLAIAKAEFKKRPSSKTPCFKKQTHQSPKFSISFKLALSFVRAKIVSFINSVLPAVSQMKLSQIITLVSFLLTGCFPPDDDIPDIYFLFSFLFPQFALLSSVKSFPLNLFSSPSSLYSPLSSPNFFL